MKQVLKRLCAGLLVLCMVVSLLPMSALAAVDPHPKTTGYVYGSPDGSYTKEVTLDLSINTSSKKWELTAPNGANVTFGGWERLGSASICVKFGNVPYTFFFYPDDAKQTISTGELSPEQLAILQAADPEIVECHVFPRYYYNYTWKVENGDHDENETVYWSQVKTLPTEFKGTVPAGKLFVGWTDGSLIYPIGTSVTVEHDMTFEPFFVDEPADEEYTATFKTPEGYIVAIENSVDRKVTTPRAPVINGHEFSHWEYWNIYGSSHAGESETVSLLGDTVFTAVFAAKEFTWTVENGYDDVTATVSWGQTKTLPDEFKGVVPDGMLFVGWTDGTLIYPAGASVTVEHDMAFEPYFAEIPASDEFTATFMTPDGYIVAIEHSVDRKVTTPRAPVINGHEFSHWEYWNIYGSSHAGESETVSLLGDTVFTAVFAAKEFTWTVENGYDDVTATVSWGQTKTLPDEFKGVVPDGMLFVGWTDGTLIYPAGASVTVEHDMAFEPYFAEIPASDEFTATFKTPDGYIVAIERSVDRKVTTPRAPVINGYEFGYWEYWNIYGSSHAGERETVPLLGDTVFTAVLSPKTYNLTAVPDNATVTNLPSTAKYGSLVTFSAAANGGYALTHVLAKGSVAIPVVNNGDGTFSFNMPASDVEIYVYTEEVIDTYTVKFYADGTLYDVQHIAEGNTPVAPAAPVKEGFEFKGWSLDGATVVDPLPAVNSDVTYTAVFAAKEFTWTVENGDFDENETVSWGQVKTLPAEFKGDVPAEKMFVGWTDGTLIYPAGASVTVEHDMAFQPYFVDEPGAGEYTATFKTREGYIIAVKNTVDQVVVTPNGPVIDGYKFDGWSFYDTILWEYRTVDSNVSVELNRDRDFVAELSPKLYSIRVAEAYNATVSAPENSLCDRVVNFSVTADDDYAVTSVVVRSAAAVIPLVYERNGSYSFNMPASSVDIYVYTEEIIDTYTVKFYADGSLYDVQHIAEGNIPVAPAAPVKEGYEFKGWSLNGTDVVPLSEVTGDVTYTAVFEQRLYRVDYRLASPGISVTTQNNDLYHAGDLVRMTINFANGYEAFTIAVVGQLPNSQTVVPVTRFSDNEYGFVMPAEDVWVCVDKQPLNNQIRFVVDNDLYAYAYAETGSALTLPATPVKEGYTFVGWKAESDGSVYTDALPIVTADETYTAIMTKNTHTLTYYRGAEADASEFKTILTVYDKDGNESVVEFFNDDATDPHDRMTYPVKDIEAGAKVKLGEPALTGYIFQYWVDEDGNRYYAGANFTMPDADVLLTAVWEEDKGPDKTVLVRFVVDGALYDGFLAYADETHQVPAGPEIPGREFQGWEYNGVRYTADNNCDFVVVLNENREMTFVAQFEELKYQVSVDPDIEGTTATVTTDLGYGDTVVLPAAPTKEGFTFVAWRDTDNGAYYGENAALTVTRDHNLVAVWSKDTVEFAVKFFDENGNLFDVFVVPAGTILTAPDYVGEAGNTYVWFESTLGLVREPGTEIAVNDHMRFTATVVTRQDFNVTVNVQPDGVTNVYQLDATAHKMGDVVTMKITVPTGYILKTVNGLGNLAGTAVVLDDVLIQTGDNEFTYYFNMPAADVALNIVLEEIPAGFAVVKFVNDGDLYDYVLVEKGSNGVAPAVEPTKDGAQFIRWESDDAFVGAGETFAVPADAADVIVYNAVYQTLTYKIHYNANEGTPDPADETGKLFGESITLAPAVSRDGYVFIGWREDATGMVYGAEGNYVVKGDATFTAVWEATECVVRFIDPATGIIYGYEPVSGNQQVTAPEAPVVAGKTFLHWVNKENASDVVMAGAQTPAIIEDTTYYAVYEVTQYSVTVNAENCTVDIASGMKNPGDEVTFTVNPAVDCTVTSVIISYTDALSPVIRELKPDASGVYSFTMPAANVTLTARAERNVFSVFTDAQAGSIITVANKAAAGTPVAFTVAETDSNHVVKNVYVLTESGKPVALTVTGEGAYLFEMPAEDVTIHTTVVLAEFTVTFLDSDNTLLGIVPVNAGEFATAPVAEKNGYHFDHWEVLPVTVPGKTYDPAADKVEADLIVRAVYVGDPFTVEAGLTDNVIYLKAESQIHTGNVNSSDLLVSALNTEAGTSVTFTVAAKYDYTISGIAVVGKNDSKTAVQTYLVQKETKDGVDYFTYSFTMPADDVIIDVYTTAKMYRVDVEENLPFAGDYTLNGFRTNNLMIPQGDQVSIEITPIPGYQVVNVTGTFFDGASRVSLVDCVLNADKTLFTFPMVARDVHVVIEYAPIDYSIEIETSNALTYRPDASQNPAKVVESLEDELTSKGRIELDPYVERDFTNALNQVFKIPANGTSIVGNRVFFRIVEYTGYDLESVTVTYEDGNRVCEVLYRDGKYYFDMPADDVVITAVFVEETHTVIKNANAQTHGTVEINGLVENRVTASYKDLVEVTVVPDAGYQVSKIYYVLADGTVMDFDVASYDNAVMTDVLDTEHGITFHMPASDVEVFVEYEAIHYTVSEVTEHATVNGYTTPSHVGEQVVFGTGADYGYIITDVYVVNETTGEYVNLHTNSTNTTYGARYYFTMPASAVTIHVETTEDLFDVIYLDSNGAFIGGEEVNYLSCANVSAFVPNVKADNTGYHFVGWTSADTQTPVTVPSVTDSDFVVVKKTYVVAAYEKDEIDVVFQETVNGTVTELSTGNTAAYRLDTTVFGDTVRFTAVPDEGYVIDTVSVTSHNKEGYLINIATTVSGNTYTFVIPSTLKGDIHDVQAEDVIVNVTFKKDTFTLTRDSQCETDGEIAVNGNVTTETTFSYLFQDQVTITATPNNGYYVASIVAVNADGSKKFEVTGTKPAMDTAAGDPLTLTFQMPADDLTFKVDYEKIDYSITLVYNDEYGTVTTDPADKAQLDDIVTITATPKTGYRLESVTVTYAGGEKTLVLTDLGNGKYNFTMPADAVTVTVVFVEATYTVTKADDCENDGTISVDGVVATEKSFEYDYKETVTITATPNNGYYVASIVAVNADGSKKFEVTGTKPAMDTAAGDPLTLTFQMPADDLTFKVDYEKIDYSITLVYNDEYGTVTTDPADKAQLDDIVTITATPKTGYRLASVVATYANGEKTLVLTDLGDGKYNFTMPADAVTVTVVFVEATYVLTKDAGCGANGTVAVDGVVSTETSYEYDFKDTVTVTATPDNGYYVVSVVAKNADESEKFEVTGTKPATDTAVGDPLTLTFQMPADDLTLFVTYAKIDYSITLDYVAEQGTVTTTPAGTAQLGDLVTVKAEPAEGYRLASVVATYASGNSSLVLTDLGDGEFTFTMPAEAVTVTVVFVPETYNVHMQVVGSADVTLNGDFTFETTADYLDVVSIDVQPAEGWELVSITVNDGDVTVNETIDPEGGVYTFKMPSEDAQIVVTLKQVGYDLDTFVCNFYEEGHGTVTATPDSDIHAGDSVTIVADPDDGYRVKKVVVVGDNDEAVPVSFRHSSVDNVEVWSFTMPAHNVTVKVIFEVESSSYYDDVRSDHWFYSAVTFVTDHGYFKGVEPNLFAPYMEMNRAMVVTVLGRIEGIDPTAYTDIAFSDVEAGSYYAPYVAWAAENGIVLGKTPDIFDPKAPVTREEMVAMMYRYCEYLGIDMTPQNQFFMDRYTDLDEIGDWAVPYVEWAVGVGLIRGTSETTIAPKANATRAEVAQIIRNLCDKVLYR